MISECRSQIESELSAPCTEMQPGDKIIKSAAPADE